MITHKMSGSDAEVSASFDTCIYIKLHFLYYIQRKYFSDDHFSYIVCVITRGHGYASRMCLVAMNARRWRRESPHYKARDWSEL